MEALLTGSMQYYYVSVFSWWANSVFFEFLIFIFASYLLGGRILLALKIEFNYSGERAVYSVMLGYGAFGLFGTLLAVSGVFNALILQVFLLATILLFGRDIFLNSESFRPVKNLFKEYAFLKIVLVFWVSANFLIAFHPVTGIDALRYHLPIMFDVVNRGKATFSPQIDEYYSYLPVFAEITNAVPVAIFGEPSTFDKASGRIAVPGVTYVFQLMQYSLLVLLLGLFYFFLKDFIADKLLIFGALFFTVGIFDLQREALHAGYIDVFAFLFAVASSLLIIQAFKENEPSKKFLLSAIMLGLALGMKYLALIFGFINLVLFLLFFFVKKWQIRASVKSLFFYGVTSFLISGFWYLKNAFVYGNPIYPMFSKAGFSDSIAWFMVPRTWSNFFLFPFIFTGQWFFDDTQTSSRLLVLGSFIVFYLLILFFLLKREKIEAQTVAIILFVQIYLSILFFMSHQQRFLLPAVMMLMLGVFMLLDKFMAYLKFKKIIRGLLVAACTVLFLGNFHYFGVKFLYLAGFYDRPTYIREIGGQ